jgi:hypothetical protein
MIESGFTLLPDGTVLTIDAANDGVTCYRYEYTIASGNPWIPCASSPTQLGSAIYGVGQMGYGRNEIGPQCFLYSGQVVVFGDAYEYTPNAGSPDREYRTVHTPCGRQPDGSGRLGDQHARAPERRRIRRRARQRNAEWQGSRSGRTWEWQWLIL